MTDKYLEAAAQDVSETIKVLYKALDDCIGYGSMTGAGWVSDQARQAIVQADASDVDLIEFQEATRRLQLEVEVKYHELVAARTHADNCMKILTGIHNLLMPKDTKLDDGRIFRFVCPDANTYLHELTKRIIAIPDEIAKLSPAQQAQE